jgi:addiction module RelB/DinJ family antitoxin
MQTTIMFKTDKKLKAAAQKTAQAMGIPFSAVLNEYMREFVERKQITFSAEQYKPTPYLKKILDQGEKNLAEGKVKTFASVEEMFADMEK